MRILRSQTRPTSLSRTGFSFVEMIVVIGIIALLIGLTLPAISQSRASARRMECMVRLRNVTMAMLNAADAAGRFPASGNFTDKAPFESRQSWVVDVLPWLDEASTAVAWNQEQAIDNPANLPLTRRFFPILTCPADISVMPSDDNGTYGNLSYVVNGGVGYTTYLNAVHDCPVDLQGRAIDLDGDGSTCPSATGDAEDKGIFLQLGLFFNETWKTGVSRRHHTIASVTDGMSNTVILSENVRTGYNPGASTNPWLSGWASPNAQLTSFYIGDPCINASCTAGNVNYTLANAGDAAINSGLKRPEGTSSVPNSFHFGGVNMSFGDGRVQFISQSIDGVVYAAIVSPQGGGLSGTPLSQSAAGGLP